MQNDEHNQKLNDEQAKQAKQSGTAPKGTQPPEGAQVVQIWRDEDNTVFMNDGNLGPEDTFALLNRALLVVKMPFFFREMVGELMKMSEHHRIQLTEVIKAHENNCHYHTTSDPRPGGMPANPGETVVSPPSQTTEPTETSTGKSD